MERQFHYKDSKGNVQVEDLSAEQGRLDEVILRDFGALEQAVSQGRSISEPAYTPLVDRTFENIEGLPTNRGLHWLAELKRIGAVAPKKAAPAKNEKENAGGAK